MNLPNEVVGTIVGGIVAVAALIFRPKKKTKVTRRKSKNVETYERDAVDSTITNN